MGPRLTVAVMGPTKSLRLSALVKPAERLITAVSIAAVLVAVNGKLMTIGVLVLVCVTGEGSVSDKLDVEPEKPTGVIVTPAGRFVSVTCSTLPLVGAGEPDAAVSWARVVKAFGIASVTENPNVATPKPGGRQASIPVEFEVNDDPTAMDVNAVPTISEEFERVIWLLELELEPEISAVT